MAVICDNTGVPVGSETCKLCVSHGCEGYKQATKQNKQWRKTMNKQISVTDEEIVDMTVAPKQDIKSPNIDTTTLDITHGNYFLVHEDDGKWYLETIPDIFSDTITKRKWDAAELAKYVGPYNILGNLAYNIKEIVAMKKWGHLPVLIDNNFQLWVQGDILWNDKFNHSARSKD